MLRKVRIRRQKIREHQEHDREAGDRDDPKDLPHSGVGISLISKQTSGKRRRRSTFTSVRNDSTRGRRGRRRSRRRRGGNVVFRGRVRRRRSHRRMVPRGRNLGVSHRFAGSSRVVIARHGSLAHRFRGGVRPASFLLSAVGRRALPGEHVRMDRARRVHRHSPRKTLSGRHGIRFCDRLGGDRSDSAGGSPHFGERGCEHRPLCDRNLPDSPFFNRLFRRNQKRNGTIRSNALAQVKGWVACLGFSHSHDGKNIYDNFHSAGLPNLNPNSLLPGRTNPFKNPAHLSPACPFRLSTCSRNQPTEKINPAFFGNDPTFVLFNPSCFLIVFKLTPRT